jgi:hypothetical protein
MAVECPSCALLNPSGALRCDCGYDFRLRRVVGPAGSATEHGGPAALRRVLAAGRRHPRRSPRLGAGDRAALHDLQTGSTVALILSGFLFGLLGMAYSVYFHARWGQTVGKMVAGIRVTQLDGTPITTRHAVLRSAVDIVLWILYVISTTYVLVV